MGTRSQARTAAAAFTLVELLVVIGIIGILVALLIPAIGAVQNSGKKLKTEATYAAIETGLETFRADTDQGYVPSGTDANDQGAGSLASPYSASAGSTVIEVAATGANLLVFGLVGADYLGTAGFKDLGGERGWWDDMHDINSGSLDGLYALNDDAEPTHRRFGTYLELNKVDIRTLEDVALDVLYPRERPAQSIPVPAGTSGLSTDWEDYLKMPVIMDGFGYPILYYKANQGARAMVTYVDNDLVTGVYDQFHNALYTGGALSANRGLDLGAGAANPSDPSKGHQMFWIQEGISANPAQVSLDEPEYDYTFTKFIWDRSVTSRNEPVNKDSFILVSPGPDALYGTDDDLTNYSR